MDMRRLVGRENVCGSERVKGLHRRSWRKYPASASSISVAWRRDSETRRWSQCTSSLLHLVSTSGPLEARRPSQERRRISTEQQLCEFLSRGRKLFGQSGCTSRKSTEDAAREPKRRGFSRLKVVRPSLLPFVRSSRGRILSASVEFSAGRTLVWSRCAGAALNYIRLRSADQLKSTTVQSGAVPSNVQPTPVHRLHMHRPERLSGAIAHVSGQTKSRTADAFAVVLLALYGFSRRNSLDIPRDCLQLAHQRSASASA